MIKVMNLPLKKIVSLALIGLIFLSFLSVVNAVDNVPPVNLNQAPPAGSPFGGFRIVQCDGPANLNHIRPDTREIDLTYRLDSNRTEFIKQFNHEPPFVPCNFTGLMIQAQFLINAAIVVGVLVALIGFAYAGFLYITGTQENLKKAHAIFPKIFWGFIIMLTAWFMVYQILKWLTPDGSAYLQ